MEYHVLVRSMKLTSHHQPGEFRKGQKETGDAGPQVLPIPWNPPDWIPSWLSDACVTRREHIYISFPCSSAGEESACNAGDPSLIPGLGRSAGEGLG